MTDNRLYKNAVLDDKELQESLKGINPEFGEFFTRVAGEAWGLPLIDQKTKAFITIAVDVVNQEHTGSSNPFAVHMYMALKQGATRAEIEELLLFMCVYAGFNKVAGCFGRLNEIFEQSGIEQMISAMKKADYAIRDQKGKTVFYVLLWKRKGITLDNFDDYWRNVHGPVCARLPSQHQYWQFHLAHNEGDLLPAIDGIEYNTLAEDQFDGIAQFTFETEADRQTWFNAATILMDDEHNLFSKAIGYNTSPGNSKTYVDGIERGDPNGDLGILKFHVMVKKSNAVSVDEFRKYMTDSFAPAVVNSDLVLKFRLHLFEEVDNSRPNAAGVSHHEPAEKQYQAAFEIAFSNPLEMEKFFASIEYAQAVKNQAKYVKQLCLFPERSAYTFVYDGQMTLAGQRSSRVAELIAKIGATNQLKEDIVSLMSGKVSLMSGKQNVKSGLGHYLQGVQHVGVTVHDMAKSLEFYIDVLGGKLAIAENDLVGDGMQNTLFQKEELDAITQGVDPKNFDIPNLRDAKEALDVKFISFGNACIELIYFKNAATPNAPTTSSGSIPSNIGHVNAMHISFHVKDDVDLNVFAKMLEEECQKRGLTNVVFNRVIRVKSEEERRNIALKYNSNKFWDEPDLLAEDQPEADFGEFEGWALFYCKGPNGEQLEFNQVTRKAKGHFAKAQEEYNMANGTSFAVSEAKVSSMNATQERAMSERLYATFSSPVNASLETAWNVLLDKIENPGRYNPEAQDYKILEKHGNEVLREMKALNMTIKERIAWDEKTLEIRHTLVHNPLFMGQTINTIVPPTSNNPNDLPIITYTLDWEPYNNEARHVAQEIQQKLTQAVQQSVLNSKTVAEQQDAQKESRFAVSDAKVEATTIKSIDNKGVIMSEQLQAVVQLSESVLKEDWEQVKPFLTEDILYKVGSAEPVYGKQSVVAFLSSMFANTAKFTGHEIRKIWNEPGIIVVEMDAKYTTVKDKKHLTIACCDIYRMRGNQVSEWRVYADILPFYQTDLQEQQTQTNEKGNKQLSGVGLRK